MKPVKNMARTSKYGAGTKSDAMSIEYKEYILELNATTFEVWTGDRKYRLTSAHYSQKHDGGALAQTVVRLLKKRSIWAGGENLKGITIVTKYRNNVPEEIVDSIDEALSMEGFKVNPINKPKHGVENRARNRRIKNAAGVANTIELAREGVVVSVQDKDGDELGGADVFYSADDAIEYLSGMGLEFDRDEVIIFFDSETYEASIDVAGKEEDTFRVDSKDALTNYPEPTENKSDPYSGRKTYQLQLNKNR